MHFSPGPQSAITSLEPTQDFRTHIRIQPPVKNAAKVNFHAFL